MQRCNHYKIIWQKLETNMATFFRTSIMICRLTLIQRKYALKRIIHRYGASIRSESYAAPQALSAFLQHSCQKELCGQFCRSILNHQGSRSWRLLRSCDRLHHRRHHLDHLRCHHLRHPPHHHQTLRHLVRGVPPAGTGLWLRNPSLFRASR